MNRGKLGSSVISHLRGGRESEAQRSGSRNPTKTLRRPTSWPRHSRSILCPTNWTCHSLQSCGCARRMASSALVRSCTCCRSSRISCAWSRSPCEAEVTPYAAQADHRALWRSCWSSATAVGHVERKYCLVLSAVLISGKSSDFTAARPFSSDRSATTDEKSKTKQ